MSGESEIITRLARARNEETACVLVTVTATRGSVPRHPGAKMLVFADGATIGTIGGGKFEALVLDEAREAFRTRQPVSRCYPLHEKNESSFGAICGGEVTVFIEPHLPAPRLFIFGAGHCAQALVRAARLLEWRITVIEDRPEWLDEMLKDGVVVSDATPETFLEGIAWRSQDAVVLLSRNAPLDALALRALLRLPAFPPYLGMIGSRRKAHMVLKELSDEGFSPELLARVHTPVGLDIGADTPAEIAVSILAEILAVHHGHRAGFLRAPHST